MDGLICHQKVTKNILVAHGDLDGIISAVLVIRKFGLPLGETEVVFVQPFTVNEVVIPCEAEKVYVVDVAVNNRDPEMTRTFISRIGGRLVWWFDHHQGWTVEIIGKNPAFVIDAEAGSCAEVIGGEPELVADAIAADTRKGELSERAQLVERAMKANMSDDDIRWLAVRWLLGDESARDGLEEVAKKYARIQAETERLAATYQVIGGVALVDARESNHQYDLTQLLLAGQEQASFAVVQTVHPRHGEGLTIATSRKDVNLVELFGLASGAPFRVSVQADRMEEVLAKLETV